MKPIKKTKIVANRARCRKCSDIIESVYRHDFKFCKCGNMFVDGGKDYLRRGAQDPGDIEDMSEIVEITEPSEYTNG
jgi:hypothetical protein